MRRAGLLWCVVVVIVGGYVADAAAEYRDEGVPAPSAVNIGELVADFDRRSADLLPILVPDAGFMQAFDGGRIVVDLESGGFSDRFVNRLAEKGIEDRGVMTYPISIHLNRKHDVVIEAHDDTRLAVIRRSADYDRYWFVRQMLAGEQVSPSEFSRLYELHSPERIIGWYTLVTPEGAYALDTIEDAERDAIQAASFAMPIMMAMGGRLAYGVPVLFN
jgi:hypothetical protein